MKLSEPTQEEIVEYSTRVIDPKNKQLMDYLKNTGWTPGEAIACMLQILIFMLMSTKFVTSSLVTVLVLNLQTLLTALCQIEQEGKDGQ